MLHYGPMAPDPCEVAGKPLRVLDRDKLTADERARLQRNGFNACEHRYIYYHYCYDAVMCAQCGAVVPDVTAAEYASRQ